MGITDISGVAIGTRGEASVDFLVDSGPQHTLLPENVWREPGLVARRRQRFRLADGTYMERDIANCVVRFVEHGETPTPIVMGQAGDVALLGAVTLEELGLVLNPFTRTLHPAALLMV